MNTSVSNNINLKKRIFSFKQYHSASEPCLDLSGFQKGLIEEFNKNVESGKIKFESVPCICGNSSFDLISSVDSYSMLQKTVLCTKCGLIQSNPRMTEEEYKKFYSSDIYRNCYESKDYLRIGEGKYNEKTGRHIFDAIDKTVKIGSGVSVLEIGAGGGWNLIPFKSADAKVSGVEYSRSLVSLGREHGITMIEGGIDKIEGTFDVIIINHVLEHFLDPVSSLKRIVAHVKKDGVIYIAVPNIFNFSFADIQNAHTYYFDPKSFVYYCTAAGLKLMKFGKAQEIHMFGLFGIGKESEAGIKLDRHYEEVYSYLMSVKRRHALKRLLGNLHLLEPAKKTLKMFVKKQE